MNPCYKMDSQNPRTNDEIKSYNKVAVQAAKESNIFVEDMYAFMEGWDKSNFIDYAHLTIEANQTLGNYVSDIISKIVIKRKEIEK